MKSDVLTRVYIGRYRAGLRYKRSGPDYGGMIPFNTQLSIVGKIGVLTFDGFRPVPAGQVRAGPRHPGDFPRLIDVSLFYPSRQGSTCEIYIYRYGFLPVSERDTIKYSSILY